VYRRYHKLFLKHQPNIGVAVTENAGNPKSYPISWRNVTC